MEEALDVRLREVVSSALSRWHGMLLSSSHSDSLRVASEAARLAGHASASGAMELASLLRNLSTCVAAGPAAASVALRDVGQYLAQAGAAESVGAGGRTGGTLVIERPADAPDMPAGHDPRVPVQRGPQEASVFGPGSIIAPPPLMLSRVSGPPGVAPAPASPMSPPAVRPAGIVPPAPTPVARPIPLSPPKDEPPRLLEGTFFGFRAFGRGRKGVIPGGPRSSSPVDSIGGPFPWIAGSRSASAWPPASDVASPKPAKPVGLSQRPKVLDSPPLSGSGPPGRRARSTTVPAAIYAIGGAFFLLAAIAVCVVASGSRGTSQPIVAAGSATAIVGAARGASSERRASPVAPASALADSTAALLRSIGTETPQMQTLLDIQNRMVQACRNDPAACGQGWTSRARDALSAVDKSSLFLTPPPDEPAPAWLRSLKLPEDFPIRDEPALRNLFDFGTKNIAGRQGFQAKLFLCSAYADIFESTLVKYGAPHWLQAVVYQESGCNRTATSPCGAKGLWQFMPESARAYGLRVVEGEVDERLNPVKSTDAAIHFLTDLQRLLGGWDLALAAYNMGPYGVLTRMAQVGEKVGFWELAHAHLLPEETAGYVPAIEAYALMLKNVSRLQFNPYGKRLESTAEVVVRPGTRLSLIARASSTTTAHIRDLNPEFLRDVVPDGETTARIPDSEAHRAQAFLDTWLPTDSRDTCVPEDFDWGVLQFESSRFAKSCATFNGAP